MALDIVQRMSPKKNRHPESEPSGYNKICLYDIFVPMLCALCLCVSVLLGSPLGRVPWARLPRQKLQLGFENHFETLAAFLH